MKFFLAAAVLLLTSCSSAQKSSEVSTIRMSVAPYLKMTCAELSTERRVVLEKVEASRAQVDAKYASEKNTQIATWLS
tara:strand:- start:273 stop:506 length:234 start_codon:yes stop_codon:yes gene_type:complete